MTQQIPATTPEEILSEITVTVKSNNLVYVEGIPGAGKTTIAKHLETRLNALYVDAREKPLINSGLRFQPTTIIEQNLDFFDTIIIDNIHSDKNSKQYIVNLITNLKKKVILVGSLVAIQSLQKKLTSDIDATSTIRLNRLKETYVLRQLKQTFPDMDTIFLTNVALETKGYPPMVHFVTETIKFLQETHMLNQTQWTDQELVETLELIRKPFTQRIAPNTEIKQLYNRLYVQLSNKPKAKEWFQTIVRNQINGVVSNKTLIETTGVSTIKSSYLTRQLIAMGYTFRTKSTDVNLTIPFWDDFLKLIEN